MEQIYDDNKLLTLTQSNFLHNSRFDYETNIESACYVNREHGKHYIRGGFVFGKLNNLTALNTVLFEVEFF